MKNIFFLFIVISILQSICLADIRLQLEEPQFDLRATTSCRDIIESITGHVVEHWEKKDGSIQDRDVENARVKIFELNEKDKIVKRGYKETKLTNKNGRFSFCDTGSGNYLLLINKKNYEESMYYVTLSGVSSTDIKIYLYKKGEDKYNKFRIRGVVFKIPKGSTVMVSILETTTKYKETQDIKYNPDFWGADFSFYVIPGTYLLRIEVKKKVRQYLVMKKKIKLKRYMTYDVGDADCRWGE